MPLHVCIKAVSYDALETLLSEFYIGREEDLKNKSDASHQYSVSATFPDWDSTSGFSHRYSDGANTCARKALASLPHYDSFPPIPDSPIRVTVNMVGYYGFPSGILDFFINKDSFPEIDSNGYQRYGLYQEVWPWEPVAEFGYESNGNLSGLIMKALETLG